MSSAEDADDERESPAPTPVADWVDPKCLTFTVFVVLPNDDVCTLRDLPSGISMFHMKSRLEIYAGIPSQMYSLIYPDGKEISEDGNLVVGETILDGYLLKIRLHDNWETLYTTVTRNCIEQVNHSGGVHLKGNIIIDAAESDRYESLVRERGAAALYIASFHGLQRMANMLLSVGVNVNATTLYGRTPLHASVAKDRVVMAEFLLNKGAVLQKSDCFGVVPIELAQQLSSSMCFRKLRLMQLNFRGNYSATSGKKTRISIKLGPAAKPDILHLERTQSNLSNYSEASSQTSGQETSRHASRKHISSSAPSNDYFKKNFMSREGTQSSLSNATTSKIRQTKHNVKWKETQTEITYWKHINLLHKGHHAVEESVKVKPVTLTHPKAIVKYCNIAQQEALKCKQGSQGKQMNNRANTNGESQSVPKHGDSEDITDVMKYSKERLNYFKKLAAPKDDYVPIAFRKKRNTDKPKVSVAFKSWLARKTAEIEEAEETSTSLENFNDSESEEDKVFEFNKRVRKKNRDDVRRTRCFTPGNRPKKDIMEFGSTQYGDGRNPPADQNIGSYKEWRRKKQGYLIDIPKAKTVNDFTLERRKLEEKRQKLLMSAISYEEWMDHTEERKMLITQILKADREEMKKLEEDKLKYRQRMFSYETWKEKIYKREAEDKKRKEIQKKYDAEILKEKLQAGKSTAAVPFDEWLKKKRSMMSKEQNSEKATSVDRQNSASFIRFDQNSAQKQDATELAFAYNEWLAKTGKDEGDVERYTASEPVTNTQTATAVAI